VILPAIVAALLLAIVAQGQLGRRSLAARIAGLAGGSRSRRTLGWAAAIAVTYGLTALAALLLLGRSDALVGLPAEFMPVAAALDLPGVLTTDIVWIAGSVALGMAIGGALLLVWRWLGWGRVRRLYRSPSAARGWDEAPAAAALALAAGVAEELFFRLALPLAVAGATGSGWAGIAAGTAVFGLAHRYQGALGLVLTSVAGAAFAYLHLWTGALWLVMALHTAVDLNALILRPWLAGWGADAAPGRSGASPSRNTP
jgi:uncharacterized protein